MYGHTAPTCPTRGKESSQAQASVASGGKKRKGDGQKSYQLGGPAEPRVQTYVDGVLEDYGDGGQSDEEDGEEE